MQANTIYNNLCEYHGHSEFTRSECARIGHRVYKNYTKSFNKNTLQKIEQVEGGRPYKVCVYPAEMKFYIQRFIADYYKGDGD